MLKNDMAKDVVLMGLAPLIGRGSPAFGGYYKVHHINGVTAIEFFNGQGPDASCHDVTILPYQPGKIASANVQAGEVISGEFTGCIMSVFLEDGTLKCAHVDTNKDNPQRKKYEDRVASGRYAVRHQDDTTGKLPTFQHATGNTKIICVADSQSVQHYFVERLQWRIKFRTTTKMDNTTGKQWSAPDYTCETNYKILQVGG